MLDEENIEMLEKGYVFQGDVEEESDESNVPENKDEGIGIVKGTLLDLGGVAALGTIFMWWGVNKTFKKVREQNSLTKQ